MNRIFKACWKSSLLRGEQEARGHVEGFFLVFHVSLKTMHSSNNITPWKFKADKICPKIGFINFFLNPT